MRFDLMPVVSFLDDDGTVRAVRVVPEREGVVSWFVTRDVGSTHWISRPVDRVVGNQPPTCRDEAGFGLARNHPRLGRGV